MGEHREPLPGCFLKRKPTGHQREESLLGVKGKPERGSPRLLGLSGSPRKQESLKSIHKIDFTPISLGQSQTSSFFLRGTSREEAPRRSGSATAPRAARLGGVPAARRHAAGILREAFCARRGWSNIPWMDEIHVAPLRNHGKPIVCWSIYRGIIIPGFLGGAGFRPSHSRDSFLEFPWKGGTRRHRGTKGGHIC